MRRRALLPLIPALLLGVTACDPEHAGAAATVGDHRIDLGDLTDATLAGFAHYTGPTDSSGTSSGKGTQADFQRVVLGRQIRDELISDVAARLGVTVTDTEVQQQIVQIDDQLGGHQAFLANAAAKGFGADQLPAEIRSETEQAAIAAALLKRFPVTEEAVQAYYAANPAQFSSNHIAWIVLKDQATANTVAAQVKADGTRFSALAKQYSIDTSTKDTGGDKGTEAKGALPAEVETAVEAANPGAYLGPISSSGYFFIVHVISVSNQTLAQARAGITSTLSQPTSTYAQSLYVTAITAAAKKAHVHVSSRFGTWDATSASVVPGGTDPKTALSVTGRTDTVSAPLTGTSTSTAPAP